MSLVLQKRLVDCLESYAAGHTIADVRIGLGYTAVRLDSGQAGVAWTPDSNAACCTHFPRAGTLVNSPAGEIVTLCADKNSALARAVGLATVNALLASLPRPTSSKEEVIASLDITADDRVAMVGHFGPIINLLKSTGCRLDIIELIREKGETLSPEQGKQALADCSVAIITGTSLINGTCDEVLAAVGNPRAAVLLGPSTPFCPQAFSGTKITHLAGAWVLDADRVLQIASEGGGTMLMKPSVSFEHVRV
ncbi:MAG: DUF364 domain-containing protein [Desulfuromonadales bacterium]|nr:DUF364 domain-containing protein [Desulfuromonadales bacterium]